MILQSGLVSNSEISEGLRHGAYYYLAKPFEEDLLRSTVAAAVKDFQRVESLRSKNASGIRVAKSIQSATFRFQSVDDARRLAAFVAKACPKPDQVVTGLTELLINAVEHGNLSITYDEKTELMRNGTWLAEVQSRIQLAENVSKFAELSMNATQHTLEIIISDCGEGFDWQKYMEFDENRLHDNHGRGIAMASKLSFDSVQYLGRGNQVKVIVTL